MARIRKTNLACLFQERLAKTSRYFHKPRRAGLPVLCRAPLRSPALRAWRTAKVVKKEENKVLNRDINGKIKRPTGESVRLCMRGLRDQVGEFRGKTMANDKS